MTRLGPSEIQKLLAEAADLLAESRDREVMDRLIASLPVTDILEWDRKLIGAMLAKAGRIDDCTRVIADIPTAWERADGMRAVALALLERAQDEQGMRVLHEAVEQATAAQSEGNDSDQQCAGAVLADISEMLALREEFDEAEKVIESIAHPIRQQRAMDRMKELRGDPPPEPEEDQ